MRFRKKPVVIEARQFITNNEADSKNINEVVDWVNSHFPTEATPPARHDETSIFIKTLEGEMRADCKDWIIKGVKGEFYPCKPDIFEKTYEPV